MFPHVIQYSRMNSLLQLVTTIKGPQIDEGRFQRADFGAGYAGQSVHLMMEYIVLNGIGETVAVILVSLLIGVRQPIYYMNRSFTQ